MEQHSFPASFCSTNKQEVLHMLFQVIAGNQLCYKHSIMDDSQVVPGLRCVKGLQKNSLSVERVSSETYISDLITQTGIVVNCEALR
jgi:hypothetical protein